MRPLSPALRRRAVRWGAVLVGALALGAVIVRAQLASLLEARLGRITGHRVVVGGAAFAAGGFAARDITIYGAPPFDAEPLAQIDRLHVRLGGARGPLSPRAVIVDGVEVSYLRAGAVDNVNLGAARTRVGGNGGTAGVQVTVRGGRLRAAIQPRHGPRVLIRGRGVGLEMAASGERTATFEGLVAEVAGWLTASIPQLSVRSDRGGTVTVRAESAALIVPGGGPLVEELAVRGIFSPHRTEVVVTREPGDGRPRAVPRVRATLKLDPQGGQLAVDAAELTVRPFHAWLDRLGVQVDTTRADVHLMASAEAGRPEIPFELDLRARGFGVQNPSIDRRGWRDLPVEMHAGGALVAGARGEAAASSADKIRLDRGEIDALGARLILSGWTELGPLPRGTWSLRTPMGAPLACGRLLPAQPLPVREALGGMKLAGSLGLTASVGFDAAAWDTLSLELGLDPLCEVVSEPRVIVDLLTALHGKGVPAGPAAALPLGKYHPDFAPLEKMPAHLTAAFLTAEDGRFFSHGGFDLEMIRRALAHDLEMRAFAKGGSTITQQLAKNLFLPQSRTLARKLEETVLAWRLQSLLPKKRMLELYLNVIELGPNIRGVKQAARAYFGKELGDLRPIESAHLAALTPNPQGLARRFRDGRVDDGWMQRLYDLLGMMNRSGRLSRSDLAAARAGRLTLRKI
jgi:hypothetical protein